MNKHYFIKIVGENAVFILFYCYFRNIHFKARILALN